MKCKGNFSHLKQASKNIDKWPAWKKELAGILNTQVKKMEIVNGDKVHVSDLSQEHADRAQNEMKLSTSTGVYTYVAKNPVKNNHICVNSQGATVRWNYVAKVVEPVFGEGCPARSGKSCRANSLRPCELENCIGEFFKKMNCKC